jgi:Methyltransferase domain
VNECLLRNPPIVACAIAAGALLAVAFGAVPNASLFRIPLVGNIGHIDDVFITAAVPLLLIAAAGGASILVTATRGHAVVVALLTAMVAFVHDDVLWPALVDVSALARDEADYINVQQGTRCERCGANVRSQALARAIVGVLGDNGTLESSVRARLEADLRILEINEAGALTPWLSQRRGHVLGRYPECDITNLHYPEGAFDLVVHSDTLEHIEDPRRGLAECAACYRQAVRVCSRFRS